MLIGNTFCITCSESRSRCDPSGRFCSIRFSRILRGPLHLEPSYPPVEALTVENGEGGEGGEGGGGVRDGVNVE